MTPVFLSQIRKELSQKVKRRASLLYLFHCAASSATATASISIKR
jgi:hypothetical protein